MSRITQLVRLLFILLVLGSKTGLLWTQRSHSECFSLQMCQNWVLTNEGERSLNTKIMLGCDLVGCMSQPSLTILLWWTCLVELHDNFTSIPLGVSNTVSGWNYTIRGISTWKTLLWCFLKLPFTHFMYQIGFRDDIEDITHSIIRFRVWGFTGDPNLRLQCWWHCASSGQCCVAAWILQ